jgi:Na+-transporting NADH:ubiquinone oxidoreductase subunit B
MLHVHDAMSIRRATNMVAVALIPTILMALYNTGHQANLALEAFGRINHARWQGWVIEVLGIGYDPWSVWACFAHGALHYLPVFAVSLVIGDLWEQVFASARHRPRTPGVLLFALLFSLSLPPSIPLWQVGLGTSFGIVVGKEIFGGTGRNFVHPVLAGLAFLYATYPQQMLGEGAWTVVEGFTGATAMKVVAGGGIEAAHWSGSNWLQAFLGFVPGAFGETSTLACLIGAAWLLVTGVASGRVIAGGFIGMIIVATAFSTISGDTSAFGSLGWHWHLVLGSFAFGVIFLATDPATSSITNVGRWIYGLLIGALVVIFRVANVAHPDGTMFAILFGSMAAPLIDYAVMRGNMARRARRNG